MRGERMSGKARKWVLVGGTVLVLAVLGLIGVIQWRSEHARQEAIGVAAADWQRRGLLARDDYARLATIGHSVAARHTLSDQELEWLLAQMNRSQSPIVH